MQNNQGNNKEELVTIIIAVHNSRDLLVESIKSIQAQTYRNWELLIEDDHSDDGTVDALMDILAGDKRLHIYQTLQRNGTGRGRRSMLSNAKGRWVAFMECGDLWSPEKLERQVEYMTQNGYQFSYTLCKKIYRRRNVTVGGPEAVDYDAMKKCCWLEHSTVMYDLKDTGIREIGYSKSNNYYALWLRVSKKADCHLLDESLTTIQMGQKKNRLSLMKKFRWRYEVYRIVERQNQLVSAYLTMRNIWYTLAERNKYVKQEAAESKTMTRIEENILFYIRVALGHTEPKLVNGTDWGEAMRVATEQGVIGLALDGINKCFEQGIAVEMGFDTKMEWIGAVSQMEQQYQRHEKHLRELADFYKEHGINMMVLKGYGLSKDYPVPNHRPCGDMDIYLFGKQEEGDKLLHEKLGVEIDKSHHHHTVFRFKGESVENHYDFLNVHVRPSNKRMEEKLKSLCQADIPENADNIYFPSVEFNAIYLLRHCAAHFASTRMSVRQILDWGLFMQKHYKKISWKEYLPYLKEEGMSRFYNLTGLFCMKHLGFDASIFYGLYSDDLFDRFTAEIFVPEFKDREDGTLLRSLSVKPRRWWHNRWKNRLCYPDSAWEEFAYGLWDKVLKPSHFIQ